MKNFRKNTKMDIESLCQSLIKKVSFFENEEYVLLKENYHKLQTNSKFNDEFYENGIKRYERYLYNIVWEDRIDIENAIYQYINCKNYSEAYQAMKYVDTELLKCLGEF